MEHLFGQLIFLVLLATAGTLFGRRIRQINRNIKLGQDVDRSDRPGERWSTMARVAMGQSKMVVRPVAGIMHIVIYAGFILINLQTVFQDSATQGLPKAFESIQRTMQNLESTSQTLDLTVAENRAALQGIVNNMEELTGFVNSQQGALSNALANFSQISDSLADLQLSTTLRKADASITELNRLLEGLNNGEGTLGALLQDDTLHNGLIATNREVQNLINDLYLNPQRYIRVSVFGRKESRKMSEKELERLQRLIQEELDDRAEEGE